MIEQATATSSDEQFRARTSEMADEMRAALRDSDGQPVIRVDGKVVMPSGRVVSAARASSLPRARLRLRLLGR